MEAIHSATMATSGPSTVRLMAVTVRPRREALRDHGIPYELWRDPR
jgi:hypothetical protein